MAERGGKKTPPPKKMYRSILLMSCGVISSSRCFGSFFPLPALEKESNHLWSPIHSSSETSLCLQACSELISDEMFFLSSFLDLSYRAFRLSVQSLIIPIRALPKCHLFQEALMRSLDGNNLVKFLNTGYLHGCHGM